MNYLQVRAIYHSVFANEEKARRKASLKNINRDFYQDLPNQVCSMLDDFYWTYKEQPWFEEAWEKYRKHVLDAGLCGKIKMPGFVFNEYIDKYVDEQEKKMKKELVHMDVCDIEELYHHGIKGQKWGMRRWQNPDGTLTEAGKERYGANSVSDIKPGSKNDKLYKQDVSDSYNAQKNVIQEGKNITDTLANRMTPNRGSKKVNKKDYSKMTDDELRKKVNRLSLERQYGDLTGDNQYVMTGKEVTREILQTIGAVAGIAGSAVGIALAIKQLKG